MGLISSHRNEQRGALCVEDYITSFIPYASAMISFPLVAALLPLTLAAPQPNAGVIHVPIVRRSQSNRVANLPKVVEALRIKYSDQITVKRDHRRRGNAAIPLTDEVCSLDLPRSWCKLIIVFSAK